MLSICGDYDDFEENNVIFLFFQKMSDLSKLSIEEIFKLLESNNSEVVAEIQRFFHENLSETRESWLVSGLYDYYVNTGSINGMKLLANVREPHDKLLCDRLGDGFRSSDKVSVGLAVDLLGYIVRKQPTWLHRVSHHQMFKVWFYIEMNKVIDQLLRIC